MAAHSSILAWIIPWAKKPGGLPSMGSQKVGQDRMTKHSHILLLQGIASLEPSMRVSSSHSQQCCPLVSHKNKSGETGSELLLSCLQPVIASFEFCRQKHLRLLTRGIKVLTV